MNLLLTVNIKKFPLLEFLALVDKKFFTQAEWNM